MTQGDLYNLYFEHLAINHPDLRHNAASGQRVFAVISTEEALSDFRTGVKTKDFIFRLMEYSYSASDFGAHENTKKVEAGFIIAKYFSGREAGSPGYLAAMTASEKLVDEMIERIISDSRNGFSLFYNSLNSKQDFIVNPIRYTGDGSYAGYMCLFSFSNYFRVCLSDPAAPAWLDDGVTPDELPAE